MTVYIHAELMVKEYYAYIDEAGDEGFGKLRNPDSGGQSRWLCLGAIIVSKENDRFLPSWRDEVTGMFPNKKRRDLHFRLLNHSQRVAACRILAEKPIGVCVVASNKETLLDSPKKEIFKRRGYLYNYLVRFLLERISSACRHKVDQCRGDGARLHVTFSRRAGTDYQSMKDYLYLMRDGKEVQTPIRSIDWSVLDPADLRVENHAIRAGLQIADVVTSATASGLEPNKFGDIEPRYALLLKKRYIHENGRKLNCGLTLVPNQDRNFLGPEQREFLESLEKKKQTPGP